MTDPAGQEPTAGVAARLREVRAEIARACAETGRDPSAVTLVAVSKTQPPERVQAALDAGQRVFGENYVQEAQARWTPLRGRYPDLELHLIGPLQTNKAGPAVALFDVIQTLDREKLARVLAKEMAKQGRRRRLMVQVNTGLEPQKAGIAPDDVAAFVALCRDELNLPVEGLMAIPPEGDDVAPHAALLARAAADLGLAQVSVGMSADYAVAVRFGATCVRVGSLIFGARPAKPA